jgi:hypothetical protein
MTSSPPIPVKNSSPRRRLLTAGAGVGVVLILGCWLWQRDAGAEKSRPAEPVRPTTMGSISPAARETPAETPAGPTATPGRSLEAITADVRARLRAWMETNTGETEIQNKLTEDALALVDDGHVADVLRALSSEEVNTPFGSAAMGRWLKLEPLAAAKWIGARENPTDEHALLVATQLLKEPAQLHAYCDQLPEGQWKLGVLNNAALTAAPSDPAQAIALAHRMAPGGVQTSAFETVAYDWSTRDPEAALGWMTRVEDPKLRERLFAVGAKAIAATDPDLAATWLHGGVKSPQLMHDTALSLVEIWVAQDPATAARWVSTFPTGGPRAAAVEAVARSWLRSAPEAASAWIRALPEGPRLQAKLNAEQNGTPLPADHDDPSSATK